MLNFPVNVAVMSAAGETAESSMTCDKKGLELALFAFDFDGTCTLEDTTKLFYKATNQYRQSSDIDARKLDIRWGELAKSYLSGHKEVVLKSLENHSVAESSSLDLNGLRTFLQAVHDFDTEMSKKVEASGLLKGISKSGIESVSGDAKLNPGCINVLGHVNSPLYVISVNWSKDLIHSRLGHVDHLRILANSFPLKDQLSTGEIGRSISTAFDKEKAFKELQVQHSGTCVGRGMTVFIGDSITDLLAMLEADIGVVFGNCKTLRKVAHVFGIKLTPIQKLYRSGSRGCCGNHGCNSSPKGQLYEATSWNDIGFSLFGSQYVPSKFE